MKNIEISKELQQEINTPINMVDYKTIKHELDCLELDIVEIEYENKIVFDLYDEVDEYQGEILHCSNCKQYYSKDFCIKEAIFAYEDHKGGSEEAFSYQCPNCNDELYRDA